LFGAYTATIAIAENEASVTWRDGSGNVSKSAPAAVKDEYAEYKILQASVIGR